MKQFFFRKGVKDFLEPGALDLFSGSFGVARQMVKLGCPWVLTFEWNRGADENLLDEKVRSRLVFLLRGGCFKARGAAIICCSFSVAVTPPVRTTEFPGGLPNLSFNMAAKVEQGNSHSDFLSLLIQDCQQNHVLYWFENPDTCFSDSQVMNDFVTLVQTMC